MGWHSLPAYVYFYTVMIASFRSIPLLTVFLLALGFAQLSGTDGYMRNDFLEVGVSSCGAFGTPSAGTVPGGYHPNTSYGLGFTADQGMNGFTVAGPTTLPLYCGDYFLPGSPVEGWALTFNGTDYINSNNAGICSPSDVPGSVVRYVNTTCIDTLIWVGSVSGMQVRQISTLIEDSLFFLTRITLRNTTGSTMNNVYYARNLDPDNDVQWPGGSFTTTNTILRQNPHPCNDAVVTAVGPLGCFLALGARDPRSRVAVGSFATDAADDIYLGVGRTITPGYVNVADEGIQVAFSLGNIAPGDSVEFTFIYALNPNSLAGALTVSGGAGGFSIGGVTLPSGSVFQICPGQSLPITLSLSGGVSGGPCGGASGTLDTNQIRWRPATGLSDTIGLHVIASPTVTTTYMVIIDDTISVLPCVPGTGINDTLYITIEVLDPIPDAGPDVSTCSDVPVGIGSAGLPGYVYSWTPITGLSSSTSPNPTVTMTNTTGLPIVYQYIINATNPLGCTGADTVLVTINPDAEADAGPDITVCSGVPVSIGSVALPGTTYSWLPVTGLSSSTSSNPTLTLTNTTGAPVTTMYVVTANNGLCTGKDTMYITVAPELTAAIAGPTSLCFGDTVTLTASGGTSFLWSTGDTTASISVFPTTTTTYTVVVSDGACSSLPASHTVTVIPLPVGVISGPDSVCMWGSATLTALGGTTYLWSTGATTSTITISGITQDTTVCVIAANGPCIGAPVCFTIHPYPQPVADFANNTVCFSLATTFTDLSSTPVGSLIGWDWNFGDPGSGTTNTSTLNNPTHLFSGPGVYNVTLIITNSMGCKDTVTKSVTILNLPVADFTFSNVCDGQTATFTDLSNLAGGTISSWSWNFGDGSTSTLQNPTHLYAGPGAYNVSLIVVGSNGCIDEVVKTIIIHPNPVVDFSYLNYCFNSLTQFTDLSTITDPFGTTLMNWAWDFGDGNTSTDRNPLHSYAGPGMYWVTLTVTSSVGCSTTISKYITVDAVPMPVAINDTVCAGKQARVGVSGVPAFATQVEWYYSQFGGSPFFIGGGFDTPPINTTTIYWVSMRDSSGCESYRIPVYAWTFPVELFNIIVSPLQVEVPNAIVNFTTTADTDMVSFYWTFGDGFSSTLPNPVHQYEHDGVYTISLRCFDENGCEYFIEYQEYVTVFEKIRLFVPNTFTPNGDGLNDEFTISGTLIKELNIEIYDRWGKVMFSADNINFSWSGNDKSGDNCPEGAYVYVITGTAYDGTVINKKGSVTIIR